MASGDKQASRSVPWWEELFATGAVDAGVQVSQGAQSWLGGLGGDIASGIEGGFISILKDLWDAWLGWIEIVLAGVIALFVLMVYFSEQTSGVAKAVGSAAVMAAA
jgi:hypothetical protein